MENKLIIKRKQINSYIVECSIQTIKSTETKQRYKVRFDLNICKNCQLKDDCQTFKNKGRYYFTQDMCLIDDIENTEKNEKNEIKYYSQFGEDKFLYENFLNYKNGFFIEIGGGTGNNGSNTKFFEDELNWSGILIEPVTLQYNELIINRPNCYNFNCVVSEINGEVDFVGNGYTAGMVSTMSNIHKFTWGLYPENGHPLTKIKSLPFHEITKSVNIKRVDLFSIDVEGGEFEVLNTFDWNIPVYLVLLETDGYNPEKDNKCRKLLIENGFEYKCKVGKMGNIDLNEIWINKNNSL